MHFRFSPILSVSTSNTNNFELATLCKSLQPLYNEDHVYSSSSGISQIVSAWANYRQTQTEQYLTEGTPRKRIYREGLGKNPQEIEFYVDLAVKLLSHIAYRYSQPIFNWPSQVTLKQFVQGRSALELRSLGFTDAQRYVTICPYLSRSFQCLPLFAQGIGGETLFKLLNSLTYFFVHKACKKILWKRSKWP